MIKSYSPELIVHPILDTEYALEEIDQWLPRFHAIVLGPGLGRNQSMLGRISIIIDKVGKRAIRLNIMYALVLGSIMGCLGNKVESPGAWTGKEPVHARQDIQYH